MKYLVLVIVILAVLWLVRAGGRREGPPGGTKPGAARTPPPQDMVECPVCGVHLPRADALPGPKGQVYCCAEHRASAGG